MTRFCLARGGATVLIRRSSKAQHVVLVGQLREFQTQGSRTCERLQIARMQPGALAGVELAVIGERMCRNVDRGQVTTRSPN